MFKYIDEMYTTPKATLNYSIQVFLNERLNLKHELMNYEERDSFTSALGCIATQMAESSFDDPTINILSITFKIG